MVLVNGNKGVGSGCKSDIPNYNPRDIIDNIKPMLLIWTNGIKVSMVP